jgi:hypothetical protein
MKLKKTVIIFNLVIVSLALIGLSPVTVITSKSYDLNYSLNKGSEITINGSSKMTIDQGPYGSTDIISGSEFMLIITDNKKNNLSVELEYGKSSMDVENANGNASTDFFKLVGKKANFIVSSKGKLSDFSGFDKLPEIMTATQESLNEDKYKLSIEELFNKLPDKPIKIGDTWAEDRTIEIPSDARKLIAINNTSYKLIEEIKKDGYDCLVIESISTTDLTGEISQQNNDLSVERKTTAKGTIYFAYKIGMIMERSSKTEGEGTITVLANNFEISQRISSSLTVIFTINSK